MSKITITEALAEIPTIDKRIEKKRQFVIAFLFRQSAVRDPHEKDGGSAMLIEREEQGIADLQARAILIRSSIQKANAENTITVGKTTRTITDWLTWRREVAPKEQAHLASISNHLTSMRQDAQRKGLAVTDKDSGGYSTDIVVNINELSLAQRIEELEDVLGTLDGQLSLKNATIKIDL